MQKYEGGFIILQKTVCLSLLLVFLTAFGAAAKVNVTIIPSNFVFGEKGNAVTAGTVEVGIPLTSSKLEALRIPLASKLEAVGKFGFSSRTEEDQNYPDENERVTVFAPGLGLRYVFRDGEKFGAYGFGLYSWEIAKGDVYDEDEKNSHLSMGLGVALKFSESCALIGQTGVEGYNSRDDYGVWGTRAIRTDLGARFSF